MDKRGTDVDNGGLNVDMKKGMQWSTQRATIVLHEFRGHAEFRVQPVYLGNSRWRVVVVS